jgi:aminopeptidase N
VIFADADMEAIAQVIEGTTVSSWYEPGHAASGEAVLTWSSQALAQFNDLLGEYPYLQLHVAEVEIFNAAGVEFPQLISIDRGYYRSELDTSRPGYFEFTVAHEVVHQWFYNLVGNNQYDNAFIDEGLTNYLSARVYFEEFWGEEEADAVVNRNLTRPLVNAVESGTDPIVNFPTDDFPTQGGYIVAAYSKGPLGFAAIHEAMADEAFFIALQQYVEDFRFRVATPDDLLAAFEAASDIAVEPIWVRWFEERNSAMDIQSQVAR